MKKLLCCLSALLVVGATGYASSIATLEALGSGTYASQTIGDVSSPVVTAILSQPGTYGGHTYTTWSFLVNDGSGSMDMYATAAAVGSYVPTVGDVISASGTFSPFHQLPEFESLTAISKISTAIPYSAVTQTIPNLNVSTLPFSIAGQLIQVNNVTITGAPATWPAANGTYSMTDGVNSMTLYYWYTSYSTDGQMSGTAVPSGPVTLLGFDSVYASAPEFTPVEIIVPEPCTFALLGLGIAGLFIIRRRIS